MLTYVPHGSFLNHPAQTSAAFYREVNSDPVLRTRLKHALNLKTEGEVIRMAKGLHREPLASTSVMKVFYARPEGAWGYKVRRVPAGTLVFADGSHNPRLLQVCGNPVAKLAPASLAHPTRVQKYSPTETEVGMIRQPDLIPPAPLDTEAAATSPLLPPPAETPAATAIAATIPASLPVATSSSSVLPAVSPGGSGFPTWIFAAAAPFALLHNGGSHSGSGTTGTPGTPIDTGGTGTIVDFGPPPSTPGTPSSPGTPGTPSSPGTPSLPGGPTVIPPPTGAAAPEPSALSLIGVAGSLLACGRGVLRRRRRNG